MPSVSSLQNATIPLPEANAAARKLPAVCPDCGWATQIRVDYTRLECTNPYCTAKIVERAYKLTRYCGVETLTWDDVNSHVRSLNVKNPLRLLDPMSRQKLSDLIIASPRLVLPNYVTAAFLPHVGRSEARAVFSRVAWDTSRTSSPFQTTHTVPERGESTKASSNTRPPSKIRSTSSKAAVNDQQRDS